MRNRRDWMQHQDKSNQLVYYQTAVQEQENEAERKRLSGSLLVFSNQEDVPFIQRYFSKKNVTLTAVIKGNGFQEKENGVFEIRQDSKEDYEQLMRCLEKSEKIPSYVVYTWSMTEKTDNTIEEQLKSSAYSVFYMLKALLRIKKAVKAQVIYAFKKSKKDQAFAALDGLGKSIHTEKPGINVKSVAFSKTENRLTDRELEQICTELEQIDRSNYVWYNEQTRNVMVLKSVELEEKKQNVLLQKGQTYLITGGMGKIGFLLAQYLTDKYQANLVLTGRTRQNLNIKKKVEALSNQSNRVIYFSADLAKREDVKQLKQAVDEAGMQIDGVFHCAGIAKDNFFLKKTVEEFKEVVSVKAAAAEYLYEAFGNRTPSFMVLFSSISAMIGTMGQVDYAYGNSFLNHMAESNTGNWMDIISIQWPLWKDGGMDTTEGGRTFLEQKFGIAPLPSQEGIYAVEELMKRKGKNYTVLYGKKEKIKEMVEVLNPEKKIQGSDKNLKKDAQEEMLTEENTEYLRERTQLYLKQLFINETKIPDSALDIEDSFEKIGFDSIMAMNINQELEKTFGELAKTLLFEYPTLKDLADYFIENHLEKIVDMFPAKKVSKGKELERKQTAEEKKVSKTPMFRKGFARQAKSKEEKKDIAIIGISGKFPMSPDLKEFWENLKKGADCISEVPKDRWDVEEYYTDDKNEFGKMYCKWGGFLDDVDKFDAQFFHISPREAEIMDPQERLFLQCSYSAMEDAGYSRTAWENSKVGVYVGVMYGQYQMMDAHIEGMPIALSSVYASIANRVSYHLNLHGPSIALDTMCSSSLTSVHLACDSIRKGESDYAIAGGVNVSIHPNKYIFLSQQKFMASDGRCRSFGSGGDGYVPGEGVGAVVLKSLERAVADGDHIYGVIKASAINHGGKATGYTVPNPVMQASVIKDALEYADINPRTINYIEAHGTGTSLGDPIEISGLQKAFKEYTADQQFCSIGSVKSNIGHCESAAGIAAITKVLLMMKYKTLVPSIHSDVLNENIDFSNTPFYVQREVAEWKPVVQKEGSREKIYPRRAGISAFGAGGSNAHILMEEYVPKKENKKAEEEPVIILLSALNEKRLKEYAQKMEEYLKSEDGRKASLQDIGYTLTFGRESYAQRAAILAETKEELSELLHKLIKDEKAPSKIAIGNIHEAEAYSSILNSGKEGSEFIQLLIREEQHYKLMQLWVMGTQIDWNIFWQEKKASRVSLPTYPFEKKRFWIAELPTGKKRTKEVSVTQDFNGRLVQYNLSTFDAYQFACQAEALKRVQSLSIGKESYINNFSLLALAEDALLAAGVKQKIRLRNINWSGITSFQKTDDMLRVHLIPEEFGLLSEVLYQDMVLMQCEAVEDEIGGIRELDSKTKKQYIVTLDSEAVEKTPALLLELGQVLSREMEEEQMVPYSIEEVMLEEVKSNTITVEFIKDRIGEETVYQVCWYSDGTCIGSIRNLKAVAQDLGKSEEQSIFYTTGWEAVKQIDTERKMENTVIVASSQGLLDSVKSAFDNAVTEVITKDYASTAAGWKTDASQIVFLAEEADSAEEKAETSIRAIFDITKILLQDKRSEKVRFFYFYPDTEKYSAFDSALSGFMKTVRLENPNFEFSVIGMPKEEWNKNLGQIIRQELNQEYLSEVRYKDKVRYSKRLYPIEKQEGAGTKIKEGGIYLITGGMGGIGRIFAEYLAKTYHVSLILTGRSKLNEQKKAEIVRLQRYAKEVEYIQNDASQESKLKELISSIRKKYGVLHGILHCAGTNSDSFLLKKTKGELDSILNSKVFSTVNLKQAVKEETDFVMLFSSITGVSGNLGQADYAYANQFMNDFAQQEKAEGKVRYLSVAWPLWDSEGMNLSEENKKMLEMQTGLTPISEKEGIKAFEQALAGTENVVIVTHGKRSNLERFVNRLNGVQPIKEAKKAEKQAEYDKNELLQKTTDYLLEVFSKLLKMETSELDINTTFDEYGIESILVGYFNSKLEEDIGSISKTLLFEYQTIKELAEYLADSYANSFAELFHMDGTPEEIEGSEEAYEQDTSYSWKKLTAFQKTSKVVQRSTEEDIAIIGISGKYPMADDIYEFWDNLVEKKDCITEIPLSRWDYRKYFDADYEKPKDGKMYSKWGGFVNDVDKFDASFFHIAPKEANIMDPQERMFLETVYAAFEDAGYSRTRLKKKYDSGHGAAVGVFAGTTTQTYQLWGPEEWSRGNLSAMPNVSPWSIANRVSYLMNFGGPSIPVDTACSSSLTAVYMACESLKKHECEMAVAGGVNLYLHPYKYVLMCQTHMLSPTGKCHSFSNDADGFVPGEGVGAIILKPLKKAVEDKDFIYGVIKAAEINHGGKTSGYTVPNPNAQYSLIRNGLQHAKIAAGEISYIESHGTGTKLGDPIEINSLNKVFQEYDVEKESCAIGSVKSNIGHSEAAAGIASITKVILQMKYKKLAPSIHGEPYNENIDFKQSYFHYQKELEDWNPKGKRIAGVSSFGAGGANGYVLLQEYQQQEEVGTEEYKQIFVLSAQSEEVLYANARNLAKFLRDHTESYYTLENVAYTLQAGREAMKYRIAFFADSKEELIDKLQKIAEGNEIEEMYEGCVKVPKTDGTIDYQDLSSVCKAYIAGYEVDWEKIHDKSEGRIVPLPTYAFRKEHFWIKRTEGMAAQGQSRKGHPLLHRNCSTFRKQSYETDAESIFCRKTKEGSILSEVTALEIAHYAVSQATDGTCLHISQASWNPDGQIPEGATAITSLYESNTCIEWEIGYYEEENYKIAVQGLADKKTKTEENIRVLADSIIKQYNQQVIQKESIQASYKKENQICIQIKRTGMEQADKVCQVLEQVVETAAQLAVGMKEYEITAIGEYQSVQVYDRVHYVYITWQQYSLETYKFNFKMADADFKVLGEIKDVQMNLHSMEGIYEK